MARIQDCIKIQKLVSGIHHIKKQKTKQKYLIILDTEVEIDSFNEKKENFQKKIKDLLPRKKKKHM